MKDKEQRRKRGKRALKNLMLLIVIPTLLTILFNWKVGLGLFILTIIYKVIIIRRRKYFFKDVDGKKMGIKKFFERWKEGIEGISPLQQARTSLLGNWITLSGIVAGLTINALVRIKNQWIWIEVILFGSLILVVIQMIGGLQKFWRFKEVEKAQKEFERQLKGFHKKKKRKKKEKIKIVKMVKLK